jgi:hypothetical protein
MSPERRGTTLPISSSPIHHPKLMPWAAADIALDFQCSDRPLGGSFTSDRCVALSAFVNRPALRRSTALPRPQNGLVISARRPAEASRRCLPACVSLGAFLHPPNSSQAIARGGPLFRSQTKPGLSVRIVQREAVAKIDVHVRVKKLFLQISALRD